MEKRRVFPIGKQTFSTIIERGMVYVDKTAYIYNMTQEAGCFFLSRPRRFGKSLLCSTLEAYFEGRKDLFKGLAIEQLETEWKKHPVFHFDFSVTKYLTTERLEWMMNDQLTELEKLYDRNPADTSPGSRLSGLIKRASEQTGEKVVVIIDEYDAPMHDAITNTELKQQLRQMQREFFSPLKHQDKNLRFIFITGITKFSQMSIFSELNNLKDISLLPKYEGICGITAEELTTQLREDIEAMAEEQNMTYDQCLDELKFFYDGYHFSENKTDVYNPYSLINSLSDKKFGTYWFSTGTPTFLLELLTEEDQVITDLEGVSVKAGEFDAPTDNIQNPLPVLYQSGYLTIKDYDHETREYTLGFPNEEVREGFAGSLINYYVVQTQAEQNAGYLFQAYRRFRRTGDIALLMEPFRIFLRGTSYNLLRQNESLYHGMFYTWLIAVGADVRAEEATSDGRMDIVLRMKTAIWVFEFKYNKPLEDATKQIRTKHYMDALLADGRPVHAVGVSVSTGERTVMEWREIEGIEN